MTAAAPVIVVAIDFSETSIDALRFAREAASHQNAHLHILHVVPDARLQAWPIEAPGLDLERLNREGAARAEQRLAALKVDELPPERVTRAVTVGPVDVEIRRYAAEHGANLLVLGTHGYGPVRRFLLGSVATSVLRDVPCPVVTVPHRRLREAASADVEGEVPSRTS